MIGNKFLWKGIDLMYNSGDFRIGIRDVSRRKLKTTDDKIDLVGQHGAITGPTFARGRSIIIDGYIIASTRAKTSLGMDRLDNLFALQGDLGAVQLYEFVAMDEQNRQWICNAKVDETVDYDIEDDDDHNDGAIRRFRVGLFAPDPRYYSNIENQIAGSEGNYGGFMIGTDGFMIGDDGFSLSDVYNDIIIFSNSNTSTPVKTQIDVIGNIQSPLTIYDVGKGSGFFLDVNAGAGSQIIVDSKNLTVTLDGVNISSLRLPGSSRPSAYGVTQFVIYDANGGLIESDFNVVMSYQDTLL